jgi:hypothetical protein
MESLRQTCPTRLLDQPIPPLEDPHRYVETSRDPRFPPNAGTIGDDEITLVNYITRTQHIEVRYYTKQ